MNRRAFLAITTAGLASAALPARADGMGPLVTALSRPKLLEIVHDDTIVRAIGERYRESVPAEDNADILCAAINDGVFGAVLSHAAPESIRAIVEERVQRDFDAGRTMTLCGWVLSQTEARQCALFSIVSG